MEYLEIDDNIWMPKNEWEAFIKDAEAAIWNNFINQTEMNKKQILNSVWEMIDRVSATYSRGQKLELLEELAEQANRKAARIENAMDQLGEQPQPATEEELNSLKDRDDEGEDDV